MWSRIHKKHPMAFISLFSTFWNCQEIKIFHPNHWNRLESSSYSISKLKPSRAEARIAVRHKILAWLQVGMLTLLVELSLEPIFRLKKADSWPLWSKCGVNPEEFYRFLRRLRLNSHLVLATFELAESRKSQLSLLWSARWTLTANSRMPRSIVLSDTDRLFAFQACR